MDIDWMRIALGAALGAAIGGFVVLAISVSAWLLPGRRRRVNEELGVVTETRRSGLRLPGPWWVSAGIVGVSTVAYLAIGAVVMPPPGTSPRPPAPLAAVAPQAAPAPDHARIDLGGVVLAFDPPTGYCLFPERRIEAVQEVQRKANTDNVVHTAFGDCAELAAAERSGARIRDFGMLMTPASMMGKPVDQRTLASLAKERIDAARIRETADRRIGAAQARLAMRSFSSVGILERRENAVYYGFLSRVRAGGESFDQASIMALAVVGGRLVSYYLYSDYSKNPRPVLLRLLARARTGIADFAALNP